MEVHGRGLARRTRYLSTTSRSAKAPAPLGFFTYNSPIRRSVSPPCLPIIRADAPTITAREVLRPHPPRPRSRRPACSRVAIDITRVRTGMLATSFRPKCSPTSLTWQSAGRRVDLPPWTRASRILCARGLASGAMEQTRRDALRGVLIVRIVATACLVAGIVVGFFLPLTSVGVDGTSLQDLAKAHSVDCGSALHQTYQSVVCQNALSGRKTLSLVLMILGAVVLIGTAGFVRPGDASAGSADLSRRMRVCAWSLASVGWAYALAMCWLLTQTTYFG